MGSAAKKEVAVASSRRDSYDFYQRVRRLEATSTNLKTPS